MKVLISAGTMGGSGGAQRALRSTLRALADDQVDVVARKIIGHEHLDANVRVWSNLHWRWRGSDSRVGMNAKISRYLINPLRRTIFPDYDVYIRLFQGADLTNAVRAGLRLIVPSGNPVSSELANRYDFVAMQAPDNATLLEDPSRGTLVRPPLYEPSEWVRVPDDVSLPDKFILTVFNPYGPIKGTEDLGRVVDQVPMPIVWCHSGDSLAFDIPSELHEHPNLVHVESPSPAELRFLYQRCVAYVCFSLSEGFGWSIADGLRYSPKVISRQIGILTNPEALDDGVFIVDDDWDLDWSAVLKREAAPFPGRNLDWHAPEKFRERLIELLDGSR